MTRIVGVCRCSDYVPYLPTAREVALVLRKVWSTDIDKKCPAQNRLCPQRERSLGRQRLPMSVSNLAHSAFHPPMCLNTAHNSIRPCVARSSIPPSRMTNPRDKSAYMKQGSQGGLFHSPSHIPKDAPIIDAPSRRGATTEAKFATPTDWEYTLF